MRALQGLPIFIRVFMCQWTRTATALDGLIVINGANIGGLYLLCYSCWLFGAHHPKDFIPYIAAKCALSPTDTNTQPTIGGKKRKKNTILASWTQWRKQITLFTLPSKFDHFSNFPSFFRNCPSPYVPSVLARLQSQGFGILTALSVKLFATNLFSVLYLGRSHN